MASIRPIEPGDVPAMAGLMRENIPGWSLGERFLTETLIEHPWADDELTSLVAADDSGAVIGAIGAQARPLRFGDRDARGVCVSHLVVASGKRGGAAGALLLRKMLGGPQDLTWSDSAIDTVERMWVAFGGHVDTARACDWMLVLRPTRWFRGVAGTAARRRPLSREQIPVGALPAHAARPRRARAPAEDTALVSRDATPAEIVEHLPAMARGVRLRVDQDAAHLEHTFAQVEAAGFGPLVTRIAWTGDRPAGWYAYRHAGSGVSRVLHLLASDRDREAVFARLVEDARADGAAVLAGRLEPGLESPLADRLAVLGLARRPLIHSRDPELAATAATSAGLLTQLDGEWYVT